MLRNSVIVATILFVSVLHCGDGSRILAVFPTASVSHQVVFRELTLALNKRGHELVVVTTDPVKDPTLKNYTEIDISILYNMRFEKNLIIFRSEAVMSAAAFATITPLFEKQTEQILSHPELKKLYQPNSGEKFDLILMEMLISPAFLTLAKRFNAPIVGITSLGLALNIQYSIGNAVMPSHPSTWEIHSKDFAASTFWQRLNNYITIWNYLHYYRTVFMSNLEAIAKKYFEIDTLDLIELEKNVSVIFVNQQGPISYVRPRAPNVIDIGGLHVSKQIKSLPKDLQKVLDEATAGFIYMSLGTNVRSNMLSAEARSEFMAAFSKLPYKVIWKFEDDVLPDKPDNVIIMKWAPQQAILAHPNIKAFIYQGGLQSTEEAISHAVPLIGVPIVGDQDLQINKMVSIGVARKLEILNVNRDDLLEAIRAVTLDSSFKERMLSLRSVINDKPYDPLENAVWWTEYVIRHRGAPHLHSSTADEPWYTRQNMDIVAFISAGSAVVLTLSIILLFRLAKSIHSYTTSSLDIKKKN